MNCPECGHGLHDVKDSRTTAVGDIRRRRQCRQCDTTWTTFEIAVELDGRTDFRGPSLRMAFEQVLIRRATVAFRGRLRGAVEPILDLLRELEK